MGEFVRFASIATSLAVALLCVTVRGAKTDSASVPLFRLDLTLADVPANSGSSAYWPTMAQSKSLALSFSEATGVCMQLATQGIRSPLARLGAVTGLELGRIFLDNYLPFGVTWMHEEFHRAVLSNREISSYDGIYDFNPDITQLNVYHVSDEALKNLKAEHPEELVRCEAAGYEAQVDLAEALLQDGMMHGSPFIEPSALYSLFSMSFYMWFNTTSEADEETREFNAKETTIDQRDIVGWDFSAWTYDLHRPDEPYAARGVHPGGVGINRYILWSQLTSAEQSYLRLQAALSLANFVRPQLYGAAPWHAGLFGEDVEFTAGLRHYLTPFGYEIGAITVMRKQDAGLVASVNVYGNGHLALPGIDCTLLNLPLGGPASFLSWSPRLALWLQPKGQRLDSEAAQAGMLASERLDVWLSSASSAYAEIEAKSGGWVAGTVSLGPALALRVGSVLAF